MNGRCVFLLRGQVPFKLVDASIVAMVKARIEVEPNFPKGGMIFKRVGNRGSYRIKDLGKDHVLCLISLGVFEYV